MQPTIDLERALQEAADALRRSQHVVALVGAGLSAESGIPTYRGTGGLWTRFAEPTIDGWDLFVADAEAWWKHALDESGHMSEFSRAIDAAEPNAGHLAMAELERMGRLRHIITQNIDNLHQRAGSRAITEIHGNRFLARCMTCGQREPLDRLSFDRLPPLCIECGGIMKNDTVMFGEPIPDDALRASYMQAALADAFIVVGTSAVVYPAADFPVMAKRRGAMLIEVNPEETALTELADIVVRAPAGESLPALVDLLREM
ncbi:MAG TPA: NAD-dependent deacylase [Tepidiformaceae bacterium]|nr:NAD-dependent deacylase [Tepidiformaceae bacterium]